MKIAIAVHDNMVSSVFDFAGQILVAETASQDINASRRIDLPVDNDSGRVSRLVEAGVNVLICGAISRCLASMIMASGIEIVPFVSGNAEQVLQAYLNGRLGEVEFLQPGCGRGARRGFRGGCGRGQAGKGRGMGRRTERGFGRGIEGQMGPSGFNKRI